MKPKEQKAIEWLDEQIVLWKKLCRLYPDTTDPYPNMIVRGYDLDMLRTIRKIVNKGEK